MKSIFFLVIFLIIFLPVVSAGEKINGLEVEWESSSYTLSWSNPTISKGDFTINVIDFDWKGDAVVSVTNRGETQNGILSEGENTIFDFTKNTTYFMGVRILADKISNSQYFPPNVGTYPCCPEAAVTIEVSKAISQKKPPALKLILTPNWEGKAGTPYKLNIQINNTGDEPFSEGNITLNISGLIPVDERELSDYGLSYNISKRIIMRSWFTPLLANHSYELNLSLKSPIPSKLTTFTIDAESYFKDFNGKIYPARTSATVSIDPAIEINKEITASTIMGERIFREVSEGYLGLGKLTVVNIYVTNQQTYPVKSVNLIETLIGSFKLMNNSVTPIKDLRFLDNNTRLQWVFDLNSSERKEFRYETMAQKTGTFSAPQTIAEWTEWGTRRTVSSDSPSTRVYGVFVLVSKRADKSSIMSNESLNVTMSLENIGDFPVGINVTDILPENTAISSGITTFKGYLRPMENVDMTYSISPIKQDIIPEEIELPSPDVRFWKKEYEGSFGFIPAMNISIIKPTSPLPVINISENITINVTETPIPKSLLEAIGDTAPWIEGAVPIIMLFIAIILMMVMHVHNR